MKISGKIVLIDKRRILSGEITLDKGKIIAIEPKDHVPDRYLMPGFIDAHIHIESSMLVPSEFARLAVKHGTVATVSDPHEIANVLGLDGVKFMLDNAAQTPFKFYFGAPSCVPATAFETAGAHLGVKEIEELLQDDRIKYLSEMMNFPGVIHQDGEVIGKIEAAKRFGKPIDGHAPGLRGESIKKYAQAGISTDHECVDFEEALEKIGLGMKILIREGSAAKNFEALKGLLKSHPESVMLCSDDKHPHELINGHINELVMRSLGSGADLFDVLNTCISHPIDHYGLDVGRLRVGDPADFIVVNNLREFKVHSTFINGREVFSNENIKLNSVPFSVPNRFDRTPLKPSALKLVQKTGLYRVIEVMDGSLLTLAGTANLKSINGELQLDLDNDILKMVVLSRYDQSPPAIALVKNFGFKRGAIASSVAHDSHNIIAVGTNDQDITRAINEVIRNKGGLALSSEHRINSIPLAVAGLMSDQPGEEVAKAYSQLHHQSLKLGSTLHDPFMMLSFCALLVIPEIKLSDKGLFDGNNFSFVPLKMS